MLIGNSFYLRNKGAIGICCKSGSMMLGLSLRLGNHREDKKGSKDLKKKWKEIYVWIKRKLKKNSFEVFKSKKSSKKIHDTHQRGKIKYEFRNLEALLAPKKDNELKKCNEISKYTN